jgi:hypothetical protein
MRHKTNATGQLRPLEERMSKAGQAKRLANMAARATVANQLEQRQAALVSETNAGFVKIVNHYNAQLRTLRIQVIVLAGLLLMALLTLAMHLWGGK